MKDFSIVKPYSRVSIKSRLIHFPKDEFLLFAFLTVIIFSLKIILGFNGLYGQDSYEYLRFTNSLNLFFHKGIFPGEFYWPVGYPIISSILNLLIDNGSASLQLISVLSFFITVYYLNNLLKILYGKSDVIIYVLLFFCFSPYIFRSAFLVMSESLSVFCISAGFYHIVKYSYSISSKDFLFALFFISSSVLVRYANFVIILIPSIYLAIFFFKNFKLKNLLIGFFVTALVFLPHLLIHQNHSMNFLGHEWLREWSLKNFFSDRFFTDNGSENYMVINLIYPLLNLVHPAFIFTGFLFLVLFRKKNLDQKTFKILSVVLSSLILYYLFLSGIPYQNLRFLIPSFPFVALLLFPGFKNLREKLKSKNVLVILILIFFLFQGALIYKYSVGILDLNKLENETAAELKKFDNQKTIYTFYLNGAIKSYGVSNPLINLYNIKLNQVEYGSFVLFNEDKFKDQWKEKLPMQNWNYLKSNYNLKLLHRFSMGWNLYEILK